LNDVHTHMRPLATPNASQASVSVSGGWRSSCFRRFIDRPQDLERSALDPEMQWRPLLDHFPVDGDWDAPAARIDFDFPGQNGFDATRAAPAPKHHVEPRLDQRQPRPAPDDVHLEQAIADAGPGPFRLAIDVVGHEHRRRSAQELAVLRLD